MSAEREESIHPAVTQLTEELRSERAVLCDPKQNLVRRLEALYHLKTAAFDVHPRLVDTSRSHLPAHAVAHHNQENAAKAAAAAAVEKNDAAAAAASAAAQGEQSDVAATKQQSAPSTPLSAAAAAPPLPGCVLADEHELVSFVIDAYHEAVDSTDSVLLQHELLYNLGQMGAKRSIPHLISIVKNFTKYSEVSRHEAIEAIGAIGFPDDSIPALNAALESLKEHAAEALTPPITESAVLAFRRLNLVKQYGHAHVLHEHAHRDFVSVDPAPPNGMRDLKELRQLLLDPEADLFARYQAMFALRNINSPKAVEVLCEGLVQDKTSCLFRHEIAFVLGQMEYSSSVPALKHALLNDQEHGMVRHEAAEALGAIGSEECKALLTEYVKHSDKLVSDSCYAALQLMGPEQTEVIKIKFESN